MQEREAPPSSLSIGLLIDGKYRLIGQRGEGAMGSVWQAEHAQLGYAVAIKFLHKAMATMRDSRGRFEREALVAAKLGEESRHVTKVFDHGVMPTGLPYVVMELLEGEGLDAALKRKKRLPLKEATRIVSQLSRALETAHAHGVVHRDLKPANIFLCHDADGEEIVKLLDFGVAKATLDNVSFATTRAGSLVGTPSYMAPEQISVGQEVDARTDLWALAVVTYRVLTGEMPFGRGTVEELALRIMTVDPRPPRTLVADLPPSVDAWMQRGLAKKPENRFASAREMAQALVVAAKEAASAEAAARSSKPSELRATFREPRAVVPLPELGATNASTLLSEDDALVVPSHRAPPSKTFFVLVAVAALLSGGLVTYLVVARSHQSTPLPQASASPSTTVSSVPSQPRLVVTPIEVPSTTTSVAAPTTPSASAHRPHPAASTKIRPTGSADDWGARDQM